MTKPTEVTIQDAMDEGLIERIAALLLTVPVWVGNYTASKDAAKWMVDEARRVRWEITVSERQRP